MILKILLNGSCGRMGRTISEVVRRDYPSIEIIPVDVVKEDGVYAIEDVTHFDCVVDFSSNTGFMMAIKHAVRFGKPFVSGTTGLGVDELEEMRKASEKIPVFYSPNMSIGINICFYFVDFISKRVRSDVYVTDIHHKFKKDRPSGTALRFKDIVEKNGLVCEISSIRVGDVVGRHSIGFHMNGEEITISHTANTREVFARGALEAVKWIIDRKNGLYSFEELLLGGV